jgi:ribonuclease HII
MLREATFDTVANVTMVHSDLLVNEREWFDQGQIVVGIDEVGRGALAGPMVLGAVVLTNASPPPESLNDSKLLTRLQREALEVPIVAWAADWSLGSVSAGEIDAWGLRLALAVAATRALDALRVRPSVALIDGSFNLLRAPMDIRFDVATPPDLTYRNMNAITFVKGDQRCASIAAASVLAKVHRDRLMVDLDRHFTDYGWSSNKGYGAKRHMEAIRRLGQTVHHRHSWQLPEMTAQ